MLEGSSLVFPAKFDDKSELGFGSVRSDPVSELRDQANQIADSNSTRETLI